jgi:hypothetical protein
LRGVRVCSTFIYQYVYIVVVHGKMGGGITMEGSNHHSIIKIMKIVKFAQTCICSHVKCSFLFFVVCVYWGLVVVLFKSHIIHSFKKQKQQNFKQKNDSL